MKRVIAQFVLYSALIAAAPAVAKDEAPAKNWADWNQLSKDRVEKISVAKNSDGRLELFAVGGNGVLYHKWQGEEKNYNDKWSDLQVLDKDRRWKEVAATRNLAGHLEVFAIADDDRHIWHMWQLTDASGRLTGEWSKMGVLNADRNWTKIAAATNPDGRVEVFAVDDYGKISPPGATLRIFHMWQGKPGANWSAMAPLCDATVPYGGPPGRRDSVESIAAATNRAGTLEVFWARPESRIEVVGFRTVLKDYSAMRHVWRSGGNAKWSDPAELTAREIMVGAFSREFLIVGANQNSDGAIEVFDSSSRGALNAMLNRPSGAWDSRPSRALALADVKDMTVAVNSNNKLEIFFAGDSGIFHFHD